MQSACTLVKKRPFVDSRISQPGYMECECCNPRSSLPCINIEKTWCLTVITLPASSWTTSRFGKEAGCKSCMTRPIQHDLGVGFGSARLPVNTEPRLEFLSKLTQGSPYFLMLVVNLNKGCEMDLTRSGGHPRVWRQSLRGGSPHAEEYRIPLHRGV